MLRPLLLGACVALTLSGCFTNTGHEQSTKIVNSALNGACFAARLYPCTIQQSPAEKAQAKEAQSAVVRDTAQRDSFAANQDAARRSSCETDTGPTLPVSSSQCARYGYTIPASQTNPAPAPN
jgi:hypothetical protein